MPPEPPDPLLPQLLFQLFLIILNAFFAISEIAIISLNDNKTKMMAESGDRKAIKCLNLMNNPTRFLSTIQVGITVGGFLASAFAANNFAGRLSNWIINDIGITSLSSEAIHNISLILITILLSFIMLVCGELAPKRIAMQKPESVARALCDVLNFLITLFRPVVALLTLTTNGILRIAGVDPNKEDSEVTEEEILYMVDAADEKGAIGKNEKEMIENIFEFNNMTAEDVMIHRTAVEFLQRDASPSEIVELIRQTNYSRFPVFDTDQDDIIGIVIARDFLIAYSDNKNTNIQDIIRPAYFVPETVRTDILFKNMQAANTHMAIVIDEYGGTSGLVTMEDLLEEIVGNIYDESDIFEESEITQLTENSWRISGAAELEVIAEALDIALPQDGEFDTLGGLIVNELSSIPTDGSNPILTAYNLTMKVEEVKEHRVEWVFVEKSDSYEPPLNIQEGRDE